MFLPFGTPGASVSSLTRNSQTGTSYAIQDSDRGKIIEVANATSSTIVTLTIAQAGASSQFVDGWFCRINNKGSNYAVLTPTTSTIGGAAKLTIAAGANVFIYSDGSNYQVFFEATAAPATSYFYGYTYFLNTFQGTSAIDPGLRGANAVCAILMYVPEYRVINKIQFRCDATSSANVTFGFYDINKNLVADTGPFACSANVAGGSLSTPIVLTPGWYWFAHSCDTLGSAARVPALILQPLDNSDAMLNQDTVRYGKAANSMSGGHLPATLGTVTALNYNPLNCMFIT